MSGQVDTRALRALMEKATPGPLHASRTSIRDSRGYLVAATYTSDPYNFESPAQPGLENAAYIVALVNAAPALLDEVDALRAERDKLRASAPPLIDEIKRLTYSMLDAAAERDALRARVAEMEREVEARRAQIDPESIAHWDTMREQRDQAQSDLRELQHVVWHLLDDTEDRGGRELVVPREEWERLGELVPEDHPTTLAPRAEVKP